MLIDLGRQIRRLTGITQEQRQALENMMADRNMPAFSKDYKTMYIPITNVIDLKDGELDEGKIIFNKSYAFETVLQTVDFGKTFVTLNPALSNYFKDLDYTNIVEPGDVIHIGGRARKNFTLEELQDGLVWLYRIFTIN